jgi:hypothetical protein
MIAVFIRAAAVWRRDAGSASPADIRLPLTVARRHTTPMTRYPETSRATA